MRTGNFKYVYIIVNENGEVHRLQSNCERRIGSTLYIDNIPWIIKDKKDNEGQRNEN